jgi:hypothetical protein
MAEMDDDLLPLPARLSLSRYAGAIWMGSWRFTWPCIGEGPMERAMLICCAFCCERWQLCSVLNDFWQPQDLWDAWGNLDLGDKHAST